MEQRSLRIARAMRLLRIDADASAESLADVLWLARYLPPPPRADEGGGADPSKRTRVRKKALPSLPPTIAGPPPGTAPLPDGKPIPRTGLFAPQGAADGATFPATVVTVPAGYALPNRLLIERALKPFLKPYLSRHLKELDPIRTAETSAERQSVTPCYRPAPERWFDVALLVEHGGAMQVWEETIRELQSLMGRHGAFRQVRVWRYQVRNGEVMISTASGQPVLARTVADPEGRRLCLFLTNGTSPEWEKAPLRNFVRKLGETSVTAIVQMLPQRSWAHTLLGDALEQVCALEPGVSNGKLHVVDPFSGTTARTPDAGNVPMLTLETDRVAAWSQFVMSPRRSVGAAVRLQATPVVSQAEKEVAAHEEVASAEQRLAAFRSIATSESFQLMRMLAAAPLTLPIMRLVQRSMPGSRDQVHLAHVLLSGLIERVTPEDARVPAEQVVYEFVKDVRDLLSDTLSSRETQQMDDVLKPAQDRLREFVERQTGAAKDFRALLLDPQGVENLPASARAFVEVSRGIYERRGILSPGTAAPQVDTSRKLTPRVVWLAPRMGFQELADRVRSALITVGHAVLGGTSPGDADYSVYVGGQAPIDDSLHITQAEEIPRLLSELERDLIGALHGLPPPVENAILRPLLEHELTEFFSRSPFPDIAFVHAQPVSGAQTIIASVLRKSEIRRLYPGGIFWDQTPPPVGRRGARLVVVVAAKIRTLRGGPERRTVVVRFLPTGYPAVEIGYLTDREADDSLHKAGATDKQVAAARTVHRNVPLLVALAGGAIRRRIAFPAKAPREILECFNLFAGTAVRQLSETVRRELIRFAIFRGNDPHNPLLPGPDSEARAVARDFGWLSIEHGQYSMVPHARAMLERQFPKEIHAAHEFICQHYETADTVIPVYWPQHLIGHAFAAGQTVRVESLLRRARVLCGYLDGERLNLLHQIKPLAPKNPYLRFLNERLKDPSWDRAPIQRVQMLVAPPRPWPPLSGVEEAHKTGVRGERVSVMVPSTGCNPAHPEFTRVVPREITDPNGHGTSVCGVVGGHNVGVAPGVIIEASMILDERGTGQISRLVEFLDELLRRPPETMPVILNLSLGFDVNDEVLASLQSRIASLVKCGVLIVAAAGNHGAGKFNLPSILPDVIAVGACDFSGKVADFSTRGITTVFGKKRTIPDIYGYGVDIPVATGNEGYGVVSGTSFACAYVSGIAALYAQSPGLRGSELRNVLLQTADSKSRLARYFPT